MESYLVINHLSTGSPKTTMAIQYGYLTSLALIYMMEENGFIPCKGVHFTCCLENYLPAHNQTV